MQRQVSAGNGEVNKVLESADMAVKDKGSVAGREDRISTIQLSFVQRLAKMLSTMAQL